APLRCYLEHRMINAAGSIGKLADLLREKFDVRFVRVTDVAVLRQTPALFAEIGYLSKGSESPTLGLLKVMICPHQNMSLLCLHDEPGYSETFRRIVGGMVETVPPRPKPREDWNEREAFDQILVAKLQDRPVGFDWTFPDERGQRVSVHAMLTPRGASDVLAEDSFRIERVDAHGWLAYLRYLRIVGGEKDTELTLDREKGGEYSYAGTYHGRDIAGQFRAYRKEGLASETAIARLLREELLPGRTTELAVEEYSPGSNPEGPTPIVYRPLPDSQSLSIQFGVVQGVGIVDQHGFFERVELTLSDVNLSLTRIFFRALDTVAATR
ncbi:MAG: hypothetical protein V2A73_14630, partial [Pseudomonadota bacterium]